MKKRILAMMLTVIMMISMIPTSLTGNSIVNASEIENDDNSLLQNEVLVDNFEIENQNNEEDNTVMITGEAALLENLEQNGEINDNSVNRARKSISRSVSTENTIMVNLPLQYGQTEARSIFNMINEMRTSSTDAWYWNSDNTTKTVCSDLSELTYDYDLERIAMQRAAEIAMSYSHTRPNGTNCFTAYDISYAAAGENIAAGYTSAIAVNKGWREDDDDYAGQGHRRNMLSSDFNCVGIGHVYYNGRHYWVEEFAYRNSINTTATTANDSEQIASVNALKSSITGLEVTLNQKSYDLKINDTVSVFIPDSKVIATMAGNWPSGKGPVADIPTLGVADTSIAAYSENQLVGISEGTTNLTATLYGYTQTLPYPVNVYAKKTISSCNISLSQTEYVYDGEEKKPEVTVTSDSTTLEENIDYILTYGNNINAGEAYVEIKGVNDWAGSVVQYFTIARKEIDDLEWILGETCDGTTQEEQDPSLTLKDGTKTLVEGTDYTKRYAVNNSKTGGVIWVTGLGNYGETGKYTGRYYTYHKYWRSQVIETSTCSKQGIKRWTCSSCGKTKDEAIELDSNSHTYDKGVITKSPTCTKSGVKTYTCTGCGTTKTENIAATGHKLTKIEAKNPTYTEVGNKEYYTCKECGKVFSDAAGKNETTISEMTIPVLKHEMMKVAAKAATCTEAGNKEYYTCKECGKVFSDAAGKNETTIKTMTVSALGHKWGEWKETKAVTCTEAGEKQRTCSRCNKKEIQKIPVTGHKLEKVAAKAATSTEAGNKEYYVCKECGKFFLDAAGKNETTLKEVTIAPIEKKAQTITGLKSTYTKTYGNSAFLLEAKAKGKLTYKSSNTSVVTVSSSGKVTIKGVGTAKITITAAATSSYKSATKTVTVTVNKASQSITGVKSTYTKTYGDSSFSLGAKAKGKLTYKSSKTSVVTVSSSGKVTIKGVGTAKITITAAATSSYKSATKVVTINVQKAYPTIKVKTSSKTFQYSAVKKKAQSFQLGGYANSKGKVTYTKSSGSSSLTINKSTGMVTVKKGIKKGTYTAKITVKAAEKGNYKSGSKTITIKVIVK